MQHTVTIANTRTTNVSSMTTLAAILLGAATLATAGVAQADTVTGLNQGIGLGTTTIALGSSGAYLDFSSSVNVVVLFNGSFYSSSLSASSVLGAAVDTAGALAAGTVISSAMSFDSPTLNSTGYGSSVQQVGQHAYSCGFFQTCYSPVYGNIGTQGGNVGATGSNLLYGIALTTSGGTEYGWIDLSVTNNGRSGYGAVLNGYSFNTTAGASIQAGTPAVPVPASVWLLGSGVLGLVGVRRRRRA